MRHLLPVALLALLLAACRADLCKKEPPAFELELTLAGGAAPGVSEIEIEVTVAGTTRSERFDSAPLLAAGRATVRVLVGPGGAGGFQARVTARALGAGGALLARGEGSFAGSGDACNFFSLALGSTTAGDGGADLPRADRAVVDGGGCTMGCAPGESCKGGLCEVTIGGGTLAGLVSHPGKRVVVSGTLRVTPHNGSDDTEVCDAGESGCLRIVAAQIVVGAGAVIDAAGSGYGGGGGGGGACGFAGDPTGSTCTAGSPGKGGPGTRGGKSGALGVVTSTATSGGAGGAGGGPYGGVGGPGVTAQKADGKKAGQAGSAGGYRAAGANGDTTQSEQVWVGSGGGGGSGGAAALADWYNSIGGSGGGGAGNAGGGAVILDATESITLAGAIRTDGVAAKSGDGGNGTDGNSGCKAGEGCCDRTGSGGAGGGAPAAGGSKGGAGVLGYFVAGFDACVQRTCEDHGSAGVVGGNGGGGGAGAGGGVLLRAPALLLSGTVSALGGGGAIANGGTVKLFHKGSAPSAAGVAAHHTVVKSY